MHTETLSDETTKLIDSMSPVNLSLADLFVERDSDHYAERYASWYRDEKYLLGQRLHHDPTPEEMRQDSELRHTSQRFRMWYLMSHPDRMMMRNDLADYKRDELIVFLETLDDMQPGHDYQSEFLSDYSI